MVTLIDRPLHEAEKGGQSGNEYQVRTCLMFLAFSIVDHYLGKYF